MKDLNDNFNEQLIKNILLKIQEEKINKIQLKNIYNLIANLDEIIGQAPDLIYLAI